MIKQVHYVLAAALVSLAVFSAAWPGAAKAQQTAAAPATAMTSAEVRKVDLAQKKVTLKHEKIANLGMDPMTMVFRATKPEQLKGLKAGDKVRFVADSDKGALIVTHIELAK